MRINFQPALNNTNNIKFNSKNKFDNSKISFKSYDDFFEKTEMDDFANAFADALMPFIEEIVSRAIMRRRTQEAYIQTAIETFAHAYEQYSKKVGNISIQDFCADMINKLDDFYLVQNVFLDAGFDKLRDVVHFSELITSISNNQEIFLYRNSDAIKIYGQLKNKKDLKDYPELLLGLYINETFNSNPDLEKLNNYPIFLRKISVNNQDDIKTKFQYISDEYGNFQDVASQIELIDDLYEKNPDYFEKFKQDVQNLKLNNKVINELYYSNFTLFYYIYSKNNADEDNVEDIVKLLTSSSKQKNGIEAAVSSEFNDFQTPQDKLEFYNLLIESATTFNEAFDILKSNQGDSCKIKDILRNKNEIIKTIKETLPLSDAQSRSYFVNFSGILTELYLSDKINDNLSSIYALTKKYNITNSGLFLKFYNKILNNNLSSIHPDELIEFVELFNYSKTIDVLAESKKTKVSPFEILANRKDRFENIEDDINDFLSKSSSKYYQTMNAIDIFNSIPELQNNEINSKDVIDKINLFEIQNNIDFEKYTEELKQFENCFNYQNDCKNFIRNCNIKFNNDIKEKEYRNSCLLVIQRLKNNLTFEEYNDIVQKLSSSGFLRLSKNEISNYISLFTDDKAFVNELMFLISKQTPSIKAFNSALKQYSDKDNNTDNIVRSFKFTNSNITFNDYFATLKRIQSTIELYTNEIKVNNQNILNIENIEKYINNPTLIDADINIIINALSGNKTSGCFVSALPCAKTKNNKKYTSYQIMYEIIKKNEENSYSNIKRQINLNLNDDISDDVPFNVYAQEYAKKLPEELVMLVNDDSWLDYNHDGNVPNCSLHAKLRIIDRFILNGKDISQLQENDIKEEFYNILYMIYETKPDKIIHKDNRIIIENKYKDRDVAAVFTQDGTFVTLMYRN